MGGGDFNLLKNYSLVSNELTQMCCHLFQLFLRGPELCKADIKHRFGQGDLLIADNHKNLHRVSPGKGVKGKGRKQFRATLQRLSKAEKRRRKETKSKLQIGDRKNKAPRRLLSPLAA